MEIATAATASPYLVQVNCGMAACALESTLKELKTRGMLTFPNITIALYATLSKNIWDEWLNKSFRDLIEAGLPDILMEDDEILVRIPKKVRLFRQSMGFSSTKLTAEIRVENLLK